MTRTLADLEKFASRLKSTYINHISFINLQKEIAKKFGFSDYFIKTVTKALHEYGFIEPHDRIPETWKLVWKTNFDDELKKEAEETEKILDNIIGSAEDEDNGQIEEGG